MVEAHGLAHNGHAPVLQPTNRCSPKPSPAPTTTERMVRTSNRGLLSLPDGLEPGQAERVRAFPRILFQASGSHGVNEVLVMKANIESIGKVASRAHVGGHELIFDQPAAVPGGDDRGPSPLDVMAVSVAACAHYYAAAYLHGRGLSPE